MVKIRSTNTEPFLLLRTKTTLAPDDTSAQHTFSSIVGRFDTLLIHDRPPRLLDFENILAGVAGFFVPQQGADFEQINNLLLNGA